MGMNKTVEINGVTTAYMEEGQGVHVVLMHGWGQNKEMMINIFNHLKDRFHVVALDFPGFGESGLPTEAWGVIEYESFFEQFRKFLTPFYQCRHFFICLIKNRITLSKVSEINRTSKCSGTSCSC